MVEGVEDGGRVVPQLARRFLDAQPDGAVHQQREQEGRRHRTILAHPSVGLDEAAPQHALRRAVRETTREIGDVGQKFREQAAREQRLVAALAVTGQEQLERLVEQPRRRHAGEQRAQAPDGFRRRLVVGEAELGLETSRTQHAHRILAVTRLRIADQPQPLGLHILEAAAVVPHREVGDVVVQRIAGEVAAPDILVDAAVHVVAQDAALGAEHPLALACAAGRGRRRRPEIRVDVAVDVAVGVAGHAVFGVVQDIIEAVVVLVAELIERLAALFVRQRLFGLRETARGAEGGDLDDLAAEEDMRQTEPTTDQTTVAEQALDLFGQRIGGDIEILGLEPEHQVAHAAADEEGLEAGLAQPIEDPEGLGRDLRARDGVGIARDDPRQGRSGLVRGRGEVQE